MIVVTVQYTRYAMMTWASRLGLRLWNPAAKILLVPGYSSQTGSLGEKMERESDDNCLLPRTTDRGAPMEPIL